MCLTLAVGARPEPAARLWTGRLSHPGLQFSPLRNGRNEGPTSWSCLVPGAPRRRAREGRESWGSGRCAAARPWVACGRHLGHVPPPPTPRGRPGTVTVARGEGTFRRSSQLGRTRGSFPTVSTSAEAAGLAEAGAEDAVPPAAGAGRASLTASVSHRWAGGGAGLPHPVAPAGDSAPPIPSKNSLPPGRLPGLPPTPVPFGP